ncbi:MAG: hypothetical protein CM15mP14_4150 [Rhodospirillaceae bacterium]|nr:MAG: hypothetical protein CM15mP14_4150 [Rhodospirillaceae bacterium]
MQCTARVAVVVAVSHSRLLNIGVCMVCSIQSGVTNLITGVANAFVDCVPLVAIAARPFKTYGQSLSQEIDQLGMMKLPGHGLSGFILKCIPEMVM